MGKPKHDAGAGGQGSVAGESSLVLFGAIGTPADGNFLRPGNGAASATEVPIRVPLGGTVSKFSVRARVAPGGVVTDTFTLRKNGSNTVVTATLTGVNTGNDSSGNVSVEPGDSLSIRFNTSGGTAVADLAVTAVISR